MDLLLIISQKLCNLGTTALVKKKFFSSSQFLIHIPTLTFNKTYTVIEHFKKT